VGEYELAPCWKHGARGCYSSFIYACPRFMLRYFRLCEEGKIEAERIAEGLRRLIDVYVLPRLQRGMYDTAFDRTFATMTGFLTGSLLRSRPPYDSATPRDVEDCRQWCREYLPAFINEV
jgi:dihydrodipicolinate synthase/N-acetylneuraminate lyase